ncbi:MAG: ATP-binding protein [Hyphomicrobium aestuarii]|nr:ATP-binding protein [Hyphomicrobium aestuarii]
MIHGSHTSGRSASLINDYASLLGEAVLRHRTRTAEHAARIEAELASRVKSEFIANMSHELRTPLNTVIGFSKLISEQERRKLPDAEIVEYANLIRDAAGHLLAVINDILDISKIQSGKFTLENRDVQVDEILVACLASFRLLAQETKVSLQSTISPTLPSIRADGVKLRQIFTNLISNAIKFTPEGGHVVIDARVLPDDRIGILVSDTGVGMAEQELQIALTPFGQVDGSRTRWREGTGLGLPIAKSLVELHGGELKVTSAKNKGTEIWVLLPPPDQLSVAEARDRILGQPAVADEHAS